MGTKTIPNGNITSPKGFFAGAIFAGLKSPGKDKKDIGIIYSGRYVYKKYNSITVCDSF